MFCEETGKKNLQFVSQFILINNKYKKRRIIES